MKPLEDDVVLRAIRKMYEEKIKPVQSWRVQTKDGEFLVRESEFGPVWYKKMEEEDGKEVSGR